MVICVVYIAVCEVPGSQAPAATKNITNLVCRAGASPLQFPGSVAPPTSGMLHSPASGTAPPIGGLFMERRVKSSRRQESDALELA